MFLPKKQNRMKSDKDITIIKRVAFFETQCTFRINQIDERENCIAIC